MTKHLFYVILEDSIESEIQILLEYFTLVNYQKDTEGTIYFSSKRSFRT